MITITQEYTHYRYLGPNSLELVFDIKFGRGSLTDFGDRNHPDNYAAAVGSRLQGVIVGQPNQRSAHGALWASGGEEFQQASRDLLLIDGTDSHRLSLGGAVSVRSNNGAFGSLNFSTVILGGAPNYRFLETNWRTQGYTSQDAARDDGDATLRATVWSIVSKAAEAGVSSVALPVLSAGNYCGSYHDMAEIILRALLEYDTHNGGWPASLEEIVIVYRTANDEATLKAAAMSLGMLEEV